MTWPWHVKQHERVQCSSSPTGKNNILLAIADGMAPEMQCALVEHAEEIEWFSPLISKNVAIQAETVEDMHRGTM